MFASLPQENTSTMPTAVTRLRKEVIFKGNFLISNSILQEAEYTKVMQMKHGIYVCIYIYIFFFSRKVQWYLSESDYVSQQLE